MRTWDNSCQCVWTRTQGIFCSSGKDGKKAPELAVVLTWAPPKRAF